MTATTTLLEGFFLCQQAARGALGKSLVADTVLGNTLTDASEFAYTKGGAGDMNGIFVWRYNLDLEGNDALRRIVAVDFTAHTITVDGPAYDGGNAADLDYILIDRNPREAIAAMQRGYNQLYLRREAVLTTAGVDLDMEWPTEDYWDGIIVNGASSTNVTPLKVQATPENKVTGVYSLSLTGTGAAPTQLSGKIRCVPFEQVTLAPCVRVEAGNSWTVRLWDATHGAYFGETRTYGGAEFAFLRFASTIIPDGCSYYQFEFKGVTTGDILWVDSIPARVRGGAASQGNAGMSRPAGVSRFRLENWMDETYKVPLVHRVKLVGPIQGQTEVYAATWREYAGDLVLGTHYQIFIDHTEASPYVIDFEPQVQLLDDVFMLAVRQLRYEVEPWENLTDSTTAPRGELLAYMMPEVCAWLELQTHDPFWQSEQQSWLEMKGDEAKPRAEVPYQPQREVIKVKM